LEAGNKIKKSQKNFYILVSRDIIKNIQQRKTKMENTNYIGKMAEVITQDGDDYSMGICIDQWYDEDWESNTYTFLVGTEQIDIPEQGVIGWVEG